MILSFAVLVQYSTVYFEIARPVGSLKRHTDSPMMAQKTNDTPPPVLHYV